MNLFSVVAMYSNALAGLALDRRARNYIRTQLKDMMVDIQLRNYEAVKLPEVLRSRFAHDVSVLELQSRLMVARSLLVLASSKELGSRFFRTVFQDALSASEYPSLGNDVMATVQRCAKLTSYACCASPEAAHIVFTVASRILKTSSDKATLEAALMLIWGTLEKDLSFLGVLQSHNAIFSCLLAGATTSSEDVLLKKLAVAYLRMTMPGVMKEASPFGEKLHPEELKVLEALILEDELARKRKVEFDLIFAANPTEALCSGENEAISGEFKHSAKASARQLDPSEPTTFFNVKDSPLRKCFRKECNRVEASAKEFKVCGQCRFATYCSEGEKLVS